VTSARSQLVVTERAATLQRSPATRWSRFVHVNSHPSFCPGRRPPGLDDRARRSTLSLYPICRLPFGALECARVWLGTCGPRRREGSYPRPTAKSLPDVRLEAVPRGTWATGMGRCSPSGKGRRRGRATSPCRGCADASLVGRPAGLHEGGQEVSSSHPVREPVRIVLGRIWRVFRPDRLRHWPTSRRARRSRPPDPAAAEPREQQLVQDPMRVRASCRLDRGLAASAGRPSTSVEVCWCRSCGQGREHQCPGSRLMSGGGLIRLRSRISPMRQDVGILAQDGAQPVREGPDVRATSPG